MTCTKTCKPKVDPCRLLRLVAEGAGAGRWEKDQLKALRQTFGFPISVQLWGLLEFLGGPFKLWASFE